MIDDDESAIKILENIGYYRFSAYSYPFRCGEPRNQFKPDVTIQKIMRIYEFDRELRLLITDAIERIEVSMRARIVNDTCIYHNDAHWYMNAANFHPRFHHSLFLKKLESSLGIKYDKITNVRIMPTDHPETFIEHYYKQYGDPYLPPAWMATEVLSLGGLSRVYQGIGDSSLKQKIADPFSIPVKVLSQWLHSLSHLRNVCAHHGRLWNRMFSISPLSAKKYAHLIHSPKRLDAQLVVLLTFLDICSPEHQWRQKFKDLAFAFSEVDHLAMGLPSGWYDSPVWKSTLSL
jgi:abortive infection bacteriophage resistance protein